MKRVVGEKRPDFAGPVQPDRPLSRLIKLVRLHLASCDVYTPVPIIISTVQNFLSLSLIYHSSASVLWTNLFFIVRPPFVNYVWRRRGAVPASTQMTIHHTGFEVVSEEVDDAPYQSCRLDSIKCVRLLATTRRARWEHRTLPRLFHSTDGKMIAHHRHHHHHHHQIQFGFFFSFFSPLPFLHSFNS